MRIRFFEQSLMENIICEVEKFIVIEKASRKTEKIGKVTKSKQRRIERFLKEKKERQREYNRRKKIVSKIRHRRLGKIELIEQENHDSDDSDGSEDFEDDMFMRPCEEANDGRSWFMKVHDHFSGYCYVCGEDYQFHWADSDSDSDIYDRFYSLDNYKLVW